MKFYGTINTNLHELYKEYGLDESYSVDSLYFKLRDEYFNIDFEEGDLALEAGYITFRLKNLGCTFSEEWEVLGIKTVSEMENNINIFNKAKFIGMIIYIPENRRLDDNFFNRLNFEFDEGKLVLGDTEILYSGGVEIEIA